MRIDDSTGLNFIEYDNGTRLTERLVWQMDRVDYDDMTKRIARVNLSDVASVRVDRDGHIHGDIWVVGTYGGGKPCVAVTTMPTLPVRLDWQREPEVSRVSLCEGHEWVTDVSRYKSFPHDGYGVSIDGGDAVRAVATRPYLFLSRDHNADGPCEDCGTSDTYQIARDVARVERRREALLSLPHAFLA